MGSVMLLLSSYSSYLVARHQNTAAAGIPGNNTWALTHRHSRHRYSGLTLVIASLQEDMRVNSS